VNSSYTEQYRRIRNGLGWVLMIAWVLGWHRHLSQQYDAAIAALQNCGPLEGWQFIKCKAGRLADGTSASSDFNSGMLLVVLSAPFAFLVSRYVARAVVESQAAADARSEAVAVADRQREEEARQNARIAHAETRAALTRQAIDRGEFIQKLGSVSDLLDLLPTESDAHRVAIIRQGIVKELRDLVAKHTLPDLTALVKGDAAIRLSLEAILLRLDTAALSASDAPRVLQAALGRSAALAGRV